MTGQVESNKQEELEKFVLENAVLFVPWPHYTNNIPTFLKIIYVSILNWKCFDVDKNKTFCVNLGIALDYVVNVSLTSFFFPFL